MGWETSPPPLCILPGIHFSRKYVEEADSSKKCAINARGEERACPPMPQRIQYRVQQVELNTGFRNKARSFKNSSFL